MTKTINIKELVQFLVDMYRTSNNRKVVFVVGAGVSRAAGIPTGAQLAQRWLDELEVMNPEGLADWKKKLKLTKNNVASHYTDIYSKRFETDPTAGLELLEKEIVGKYPSYGHTVLAQYMAAKHHNMVITTNFDNLLEQSFYFYTDRTPMVCGHESLAAFAEASPNRPLVIKVHNDIFFNPKSRRADTDKLTKSWVDSLEELLHDHNHIAMVVIGYGGNDGSLMNYLKALDKFSNFFWCLYKDEAPSSDIKALVEKQNGKFVKTDGFDELMFRLRLGLGELPDLAAMIEEVSKNRISEYGNRVLEIEKNIKESEDNLLKAASEKQIKEKTPKYWWEWQARAASFDNPDDKIKVYNEALAKLPESYQLLNNRGTAYGNKGQYDQAITDFTEAIRSQPDYANAYYNRGSAHDNKDQYDQAITDYTEAIRLKPDYAFAYNNRGNTYSNKGQYDHAITDYTEAIRLKPDYAIAYNNRGDTYRIQGAYEKAMADAMISIELDSNNAIAFDTRGEIWETMADENKSVAEQRNLYTKAITDYKKALELNANYEAAKTHLARTQQKLKDLPKA